MLPDSLTLLYGHLNIAPTQAQASLYPGLNALFESAHSRPVHLRMDSSVVATEIEVKNYEEPLMARSRVLSSSTASIYAKLKVRSQTIYTSVGEYITQYRSFVYDPEDTPLVYLSQLKEEETPFYTSRSIGYTTEISLKAPKVHQELEPSLTQWIYQVPNVRVRVSHLEDVATNAGLVAQEDVLNSKRVQAVNIPGFQQGWLPTTGRSQFMEVTQLNSVAWGLQAATAAKDEAVCVLVLRQIVASAQTYSWFGLESDELVLADEPASFFGFPHALSVLDDVAPNRYKEVYGNAQLGIAMCNALAFLQDHRPYGELDLNGEHTSLTESIKLVLDGLALFCAASLAPNSNLVAYKEDYGSFSYDSPSLGASYLVDIFLNIYQNFSSNVDVKAYAVRLHYNLLNLPFDLSNPHYSGLAEATYSDRAYNDYPSYLYDHPSLRAEYSRKLAATARAWWALYYYDVELYRASMLECEAARANIASLVEGVLDYPDYLAIYLYVLANDLEGVELISFLDSNDLGFSQYLDKDIPLWASEVLFTYSKEDLIANYPSTLAFLRHIIDESYSVNSYPPFNIWADDAVAYCSHLLLELQRLMPFGTNWFSSALVGKTSSVIGSMLYAESQLYLRWYLALREVQASIAPLEAIGDAFDLWFDAILTLPKLLTSYTCRRSFLETFMGRRELNTDEDFSTYLKDLYDIEPTVSRLTPPPFNKYFNLATSDLRQSYDPEPVDATVRLSGDAYLSCVYKKVMGTWQPRAIAGFPCLTLPEGFQVLSEAQYLAGSLSREPEEDIAIEYELPDGVMYLVPLARYTYYSELVVDRVLPMGFVNTLRKTLPAGSYLKIKSPLHLIGV